DTGDLHGRAAQGVLGLGDERGVQADCRDRRNRRVARLRVDRLRAQRPDLAWRVAALERREVDHPDREVERPQLGRLLDRAPLQALDARLDPDLVDGGEPAEDAAERSRAPARPRVDELAGTLAGEGVWLPDGHGTVRIHRGRGDSGSATVPGPRD